MMKFWIRGAAAVGVGLVAAMSVARAQVAPGGAIRPAGSPPAQAGENFGDRDVPGPIDSLQDLQDTGRMLFKVADLNNDNLISQKEAIDAGNLLVGGFFFRADADGNGTLTREEAQQAREAFLKQKPMLRVVLQEIQRQSRGQGGQGGQGTNPVQGLATLLDGNNDKQLQATELRQSVQTAVQGLYAAADTNRDGQMSPSEVNAAVVGLARSAAQSAFQAADADNNGALSIQEFDRAITRPARLFFMVVDANNDNQITPQESQNAQRILMRQIRLLQVPEPANSPANLIESGRAPGQAAPIPNIGTPNQPPGNPNQPRQPGRTVPPAAPAPGAAPTPPQP